MKIDDCYPPPDEIINCEFETLRFFMDNPFGYQELPILSNDANMYYSAHYYRFKKHARMQFSFESTFDIKVGGKKGIAHIGAMIESKGSDNIERISYYAAIIGETEEGERLLRKYHFDYAPSVAIYRQPSPVFHLQYAGKLSPRLEDMKIDDNHLDTWLSEPRLCYFPLSLALLINLILKEFPDDKNVELIEHPKWRRLVKKNENLILGPFFKGCRTFFSDKNPDKLFINDFHYGN
jgi:hypothetical protein